MKEQQLPVVTRMAIVKGQVADYAAQVAELNEISFKNLSNILHEISCELADRFIN